MYSEWTWKRNLSLFDLQCLFLNVYFHFGPEGDWVQLFSILPFPPTDMSVESTDNLG